VKRNRTRMVTGLIASGLVAGALAGGMALASAGATPAPATSASAGRAYGPGGGHITDMDRIRGMATAAQKRWTNRNFHLSL